MTIVHALSQPQMALFHSSVMLGLAALGSQHGGLLPLRPGGMKAPQNEVNHNSADNSLWTAFRGVPAGEGCFEMSPLISVLDLLIILRVHFDVVL